MMLISRLALPTRLLCVCGIVFSFVCCRTIQAQVSPANQGKKEPLTITINPAQTFQVVEHFGASDAWSCQFVGRWPNDRKNAVADLLFSNDTLTNGQPKGIGLSLWRFNIGAGTAEQGSESGIRDEWRRAESFLTSDGSYDWSKQAGQVWFLQAAKERGVNEFLAFTNSPPVNYTRNGKGYASNKVPNLEDSKIEAFSQFLARVVQGVGTKAGVTFTYVSPVNEPQWDWSDGGQEGSPFLNNQIAAITRSLSKALLASKLPAKINIAEAGQLDFLYSEYGRPGKGNQIAAFFEPSSPDYIGNLPNVSRAISGHSYFTTSPVNRAIDTRKQVLDRLANVAGLNYWMSEYCILGDNSGEINGSGKDLGINPALYIAKVIHHDLVIANASAWHWWLAISPYNYKDGLIYIDKDKTDGNFQPSKMLWALGNYSRFVRPGAVRIAATLSQPNEKLLVSAFKNTNQQLVLVIINTSSDAQTISIKLTGGSISRLRQYTTSADVSLFASSEQAATGNLTIAGNSIATIVYR